MTRINKVLLLIIDGMDTVNFTMASTPTLSGLHGKTAVGVAHTEIIGAGAAITPIAHGMIGTGYNVLAHRPGNATVGRSFDYYGNPVETIGDVCIKNNYATGAVGKNEAAIVLGGIDKVQISRLEKDGINAGDHKQVAGHILSVLEEIDRGVVVANFGKVDLMAHMGDVVKVIEAVEQADAIVTRIMEDIDLSSTLVVIASDHGTNPITGNHNTAPTPLCLITDKIKGRVNLGVVHNMEIANTVTAALGLPNPAQALGRDLLKLAIGETDDHNYQIEMKKQLDKLWQSQEQRHEHVEK
ncbi:2,3-bisphosphoglycerate-independent phosphoglycerate mutase [Desulfitispora alkaliphila]|uniref:alkaline phosphatase family protein n=1 Tax=Desulfitispora alkaliphila TaxID=622674 RepID=UPI003D1CD74D